MHVWPPYTVEKVMAVKRVQRRATKFILKCDRTYPDRLPKLGLSALECKREVLDFCFFFKCLIGHIDLMFSRMLALNNESAI